MAFNLAGQDAAYFNMAVYLILDHQITQQVRVVDVLPNMVAHNSISELEAGHIINGATQRIQTERLVATVKSRGVTGYLQLRAALAACSPKYDKLIGVIDTNIPPQYSNNDSYY